MGIWDRFKGGNGKQKGNPYEPMKLEHLQVGYMVDYDLRTWEVAAVHQYDWGNNVFTREFELRDSQDTVFLEKEEGTEWLVSQKIPQSQIERNVIDHIIEKEDPPKTISFEGEEFYLVEDGAGYFLQNGQEPATGFIYWTFENHNQTKVLTIEQWGDHEFELALGKYVQEYEFSDILPR